MSDEDNTVYTVTAKNMQDLGQRLADLQALNALQGKLLCVHETGQQWPAVYPSSEIAAKIIELITKEIKQEIAKLTRKPPVDNTP